MDVLIASYGDGDSSDSDSESESESPLPAPSILDTQASSLPPPPLSLLNPPNSIETFDHSQPSRLRSFPHIQGNYALHVYIPVHISGPQKTEITFFLKKVASIVPGLSVVDVDLPLDLLCKDDMKLQQVVLGREFHISLGRTVPIRVHQIDSVVSMLRQKLQCHKGFLIDFSSWEVFVNDDSTRSFLSLEVTGRGLTEISKQIQAVDMVYRLHNLAEFYKDPRPHISLVWALGDIRESLKRVVDEETKKHMKFRGGASEQCVFTCKFSAIECKIGKKTYNICRGLAAE